MKLLKMYSNRSAKVMQLALNSCSEPPDLNQNKQESKTYTELTPLSEFGIDNNNIRSPENAKRGDSKLNSIPILESQPSTSRTADIVCLSPEPYVSSGESYVCDASSSSEDSVKSNERPSNDRPKSSRWRKSNPEKWKKNINKEKMNKCLNYSNTPGKVKSAKAPKQISCDKCQFKCTSNFNQTEREVICKEYWSLQKYERKMDFILKNVDVSSPQSRRPRKGENSHKRANVKKYYFFKDNTRIRVCQNFFMKTLCVNNGPINTAFKHRSSLGLFQGTDGRGKKCPSNKTKECVVQIVKSHIESFPKMESHYTRKSSKRFYLDSNLSISKMYELYKEFCSTSNHNPVSQPVYRKIFCTDYNFSFFKPKKDQCQICANYTTAKLENKRLLKEEYESHINRKNDAAKAKEDDKKKAGEDKDFVSATFDLQSVLQIPSSEVSPMYYSRKINMYNLTIYEAALPNKAYCYAWTELNGKRGSSEIGSCLYKWFKTLPSNVTKISLFSDTCGGQNRNQNIAALLLYVVQTTHIEVIEQKFLESGHSYMEVDSMHSAIEREKKNTSVYTVHDWLNIFKNARSKRNRNRVKDPYVVTELKFEEFLDLQDLSRNLIKNRTMDINNTKVNWLKVKCFRFQKSQPHIIEFRYDYSGEYSKINIQEKNRLPKRTNTQEIQLKTLYKKELPISTLKKNDLLKLCKKQVIPAEFHGWYQSLPTSSSTRADELPESESEVEEECL